MTVGQGLLEGGLEAAAPVVQEPVMEEPLPRRFGRLLALRLVYGTRNEDRKGRVNLENTVPKSLRFRTTKNLRFPPPKKLRSTSDCPQKKRIL